MWHPEQTWSVLHDERVAAMAPPRRTVDRTDVPAGPSGPPPRVEQDPTPQAAPARVPAPVLVAARVRLAVARLMTA